MQVCERFAAFNICFALIAAVLRFKTAPILHAFKIISFRSELFSESAKLFSGAKLKAIPRCREAPNGQASEVRHDLDIAHGAAPVCTARMPRIEQRFSDIQQKSVMYL